ncbi:MAG: hypothetical protein ABUL62_17605 [Myxococcales bacterium]
MSWIRLGWSVTIACIGAGCVGSYVETTSLNSPPRALVPRAPDSIEVYSSTPPTRAHVDVALLRANQGNYGDVDTPAMVRSLAEQAAKMGCDAIFISGAAQREGLSGDLHVLDPGSRGMLATCIAYLPDSAVASASAAPSQAPSNAIVLVPQGPPPAPPKPAVVVENVSTAAPRR